MAKRPDERKTVGIQNARFVPAYGFDRASRSILRAGRELSNLADEAGEWNLDEGKIIREREAAVDAGNIELGRMEIDGENVLQPPSFIRESSFYAQHYDKVAENRYLVTLEGDTRSKMAELAADPKAMFDANYYKEQSDAYANTLMKVVPPELRAIVEGSTKTVQQQYINGIQTRTLKRDYALDADRLENSINADQDLLTDMIYRGASQQEDIIPVFANFSRKVSDMLDMKMISETQAQEKVTTLVHGMMSSYMSAQMRLMSPEDRGRFLQKVEAGDYSDEVGAIMQGLPDIVGIDERIDLNKNQWRAVAKNLAYLHTNATAVEYKQDQNARLEVAASVAVFQSEAMQFDPGSPEYNTAYDDAQTSISGLPQAEQTRASVQLYDSHIEALANFAKSQIDEILAGSEYAKLQKNGERKAAELLYNSKLGEIIESIPYPNDKKRVALYIARELGSQEKSAKAEEEKVASSTQSSLYDDMGKLLAAGKKDSDEYRALEKKVRAIEGKRDFPDQSVVTQRIAAREAHYGGKDKTAAGETIALDEYARLTGQITAADQQERISEIIARNPSAGLAAHRRLLSDQNAAAGSNRAIIEAGEEMREAVKQGRTISISKDSKRQEALDLSYQGLFRSSVDPDDPQPDQLVNPLARFDANGDDRLSFDEIPDPTTDMKGAVLFAQSVRMMFDHYGGVPSLITEAFDRMDNVDLSNEDRTEASRVMGIVRLITSSLMTSKNRAMVEERIGSARANRFISFFYRARSTDPFPLWDQMRDPEQYSMNFRTKVELAEETTDPKAVNEFIRGARQDAMDNVATGRWFDTYKRTFLRENLMPGTQVEDLGILEWFGNKDIVGDVGRNGFIQRIDKRVERMAAKISYQDFNQWGGTNGGLQDIYAAAIRNEFNSGDSGISFYGANNTNMTTDMRNTISVVQYSPEFHLGITRPDGSISMDHIMAPIREMIVKTGDPHLLETWDMEAAANKGDAFLGGAFKLIGSKHPSGAPNYHLVGFQRGKGQMIEGSPPLQLDRSFYEIVSLGRTRSNAAKEKQFTLDKVKEKLNILPFDENEI